MDTETTLLLTEYQHRTEEIRAHSERYHRQVGYVHLYLSFLVGILGVLSGIFPGVDALQVVSINRALSVAFLVFATAFAYYLFAAVLDALYMTYLNGSRIATIEIWLNNHVGQDLLIWDSKIMPHFHGPKLIGRGLWLKPNYLTATWVFVVFSLVTASLILLFHMVIQEYFWLYATAVTLLSIFHIVQLIVVNTTAAPFIADEVLHPIHPEPSPRDDKPLS